METERPRAALPERAFAPLAAALLAALVVSACSTATGSVSPAQGPATEPVPSTTSAPSSAATHAAASSAPLAAQTPPPASVPASPTTRQISGLVVDEEGMPVAGATVTASGSRPLVTDNSGSYHTSATVPPPPFHYFGTYVTIGKAGYEETHGWAAGTSDTTHDFRLYRITNVTAGESLHLTLSSENSLCGLEDEFRCRAIHILVPSTGTLVLDTMTADSATPFWISVGGPADVQYPQGVTHVTRSLTAGSTVLIQIMRPWQPLPTPLEFTLRTSLAP